MYIDYRKLNQAIRKDHFSVIHGSDVGEVSREDILLFFE